MCQVKLEDRTGDDVIILHILEGIIEAVAQVSLYYAHYGDLYYVFSLEEGKHIGVGAGVAHHHLGGQGGPDGGDLVADLCSPFEIEVVRLDHHTFLKHLLKVPVPAFEECNEVPHSLIVFLMDRLVYARRHAQSDGVEDTWPAPVGEEGIRASAYGEYPADGTQCISRRPC